MATFDYIAVDQQGVQCSGVMEADSPRQVRQQLVARQMAPLQVHAAATDSPDRQPFTQWLARRQSGIGITQLALLTRQLAVLLQSGMPLLAALLAVAEQSPSPRVKRLMAMVCSSVREGRSFADSLGDFPHVFNRLYCATVAAGEQSGHLDVVLLQLAGYTESSRSFRQKTLTALIYPVLLLVLSVAIVTGLMVYIVPDVIKVFSNSGQTLPALTRGLLAISDFLQQWGALLLVVLVLATAILWVCLNVVATFREFFHRQYLRMPLLKFFSRGLNAERYARTLGILSQGGVSLVEGMRIACAVVENDYLRRQLRAVIKGVEEGRPLSQALLSMGYFPPLMVHMIASGEASGQLGDMLLLAADQQQQDIQAVVTTATGLFEPLMLLFMGVVVLTIVLAILLPILSMNQLIG